MTEHGQKFLLKFEKPDEPWVISRNKLTILTIDRTKSFGTLQKRFLKVWLENLKILQAPRRRLEFPNPNQ